MQGDRARSALAGTRFSELRWIAETGSTNDDVLALAREGAPDGLVLVADHQTAGRGRLDRTWESPADASLLLSVLLRPDLAPERAHLLTTAMGVAVAEAVGETLRVFPVIKWPNDLVVLRGDRDDGRKVGGILAESIVTGGHLDAVVVGLGLNVNWPSIPPGLEDIATALNLVVERDVDREDLLVAILRVLDRWTDRLMLPGGREELHVRYHELSGTIGREVRVELSDGAVEGRAIEVTEDGHLVVQPRGTHGHHARLEITVGDVVHLRGA